MLDHMTIAYVLRLKQLLLMLTNRLILNNQIRLLLKYLKCYTLMQKALILDFCS